MRLLVSWLREFVDVSASAQEIAEGLGLRGFELAAIEPLGDGDAVIDFEVTANRPDCLSVIGFAREVAAMYDVPVKEVRLKPDTTEVRLKADTTGKVGDDDGSVRLQPDLSVTIDEPDLCPRYAAGVANVTVGTSPPWLASRLRAAGVRPISSIVDVTNYVLLELGHPTHAFDLDKLAGPEIRVRRARNGERVRTLEGIDRALDTDMLVIADRDRAQAVAGVMGGSAAEVSARTTRVAFESAYFKPSSVRRTSKQLGLKTEASSRFERGADIAAPVQALRRIAALLDQIGTGTMAGPPIDVYPAERAPIRLHIRRERLASLLGVAVPDKDVDRILRRLGLAVSATADGWDVVAPTFRVDLLREVDLIEEVGRHYGFDKLPDSFPPMTAPPRPPDPRIARDRLVRRVLTAMGLSEAVTFGFIEAKAAEAFVSAAGTRLVAVANPLSAKFDTLRPSLVPGLVDAVAHNRRHGRDDVGLFEIGTRFSDAGETRTVGVAWTGAAAPVHWSTPPGTVDFFDVKGACERVAEALGVSVRFERTDEPFLVPGQAARIVAGSGSRAGISVGIVGLVVPSIAEARGLSRQDEVFAAEMDLDALWDAASPGVTATRSLPRHPFVVRDLSIIVADVLPAEIIRGTIRAAAARTAAPLGDVTFFDRYQGKGIPDGSVSLSLRMTFQAPDRTLTDAEVQASVDAILAALAQQHGAVRR